MLKADDVRLTMGGEPTFVSIDDMEAPEWNTAADGPHKRELAGELIRRLLRPFAQGGIRHYGQGKWYPGEQLPRWRLACYWRTDGVTIWNDPDLLAVEEQDYGFGREDAQHFVEALSETLKSIPSTSGPATRTCSTFSGPKATCPDNVDPLKADLKDPLERRRLAALLERGLDEPAGYALPLRWENRIDGWQSSPWHFRRDVMMLTPGDSPMGLRMPLDSLPWLLEGEKEQIVEQDPFDER